MNGSKASADHAILTPSSQQWRVPRKNQTAADTATILIHPGDAGIWVTCDLHREGKCTVEARDFFTEVGSITTLLASLRLNMNHYQYANELYTDQVDAVPTDGNEEAQGERDIEKEISQEMAGMKAARKDVLFQPVKIEIPCGEHRCRSPYDPSANVRKVLFFKARDPVEPVSFVHKICSDASNSAGKKHARWIRRLTPMTRMGKASEKGLEEVAKAVLEPHFHAAGVTAKKVGVIRLPFILDEPA